MGFWDFWVSLSKQEQIDILIWLLLWFLLSTMPFLTAAIKLKKRVKVARIDMYAFILYFIIILVVSYFVVNIWLDATLIFAYVSGLLIGIILMFIVFNKISEGVRRAYIIQLSIEEIDCEVNLCYIYEYAGERAIIRLDAEGHEDFGAMWARLIHNTHILLKTVGAHFEFTEHKVNIAIFCTEWDWANEDMDIGGKMRNMRILYVVPIPATEYSLIDFLAKFRSFKKYVKKIADLNKENIELRANIYLLAGKVYKEWVAHTEGSIWGPSVKTTDDLIEEFNKEFDKLPQSSNILSDSKKEPGKGNKAAPAEEGNKAAPAKEAKSEESEEEAEGTEEEVEGTEEEVEEAEDK